MEVSENEFKPLDIVLVVLPFDLIMGVGFSGKA
jgi:hypothetical protein